jgi:tetratricopeptide (TPR) repeat protein
MGKSSENKLNRRQVRDLDIEIGFLEGVVQRDPDFVEALQVLGDDYTERGRLADSLKVDQRLRELRPEDPNVLFNYACSLALSGEMENACAELDRALDKGYRDFRWLQRDPDLVELRKHPAFKKIRAKIKTLKNGSTPEDDLFDSESK